MKKTYLLVKAMYERLRTKCLLSLKKESGKVPPTEATLLPANTGRKAEKESMPAPSVQLMVNQLEQFLEAGYEFRFNAVSETTEYRRKGSTAVFRLLGEREENSLCMEAHRLGIPCWDRDVRRYVHSLQIPAYHPFRQYIDGLPQWDGQDRVGALAERVSHDPLWINGFHRWMRAMTAQWMGLDDLHGNSVAPVLISRKQGRHKSTFCKLLMPDALTAYYTDHYDLNSEGGAVQKLATFGLINLDELDKYSDKKMTLLKNLMQMSSVNIRKAHRKNYTELPRVASFIATSNQTNLLTDPTGSRRFLCIEVKTKIDVSPIDHAQLYAQLKAELLSGAPYWFTTEEEAALLLHNAPYQKAGMEQEAFQSLYRIPETDEEGQWIPAFQLYERLRKTHSAIMRDVSTAQFSKMLIGMGVEKKRLKQGVLYRVVSVSTKAES